MKINETSIDSMIRIFSGVLLLYLGFGGELFGVLAIVADMLGVLVWTLPGSQAYPGKTSPGI